ncbi:MAG: hypothetical protein HQ591_01900 [candidate division Zixibacteria bacterium]|nr:hypothetical protein [Candidatus Tariuqbacter arcticus]
MSDKLSMSQIEKNFHDEWVLIEDPETTDTLQIKSGKVLWHSKDEDEVLRKFGELSPKHSAIIYIGRIIDDKVIII